MKSGLKTADRLTDSEKEVIEWAFNFAYSVVAGDYHMPKPMCYAANNLQDAVFALAQERGTSIKDGCSSMFLGYCEGHDEALKEKLSSLPESK